MQKWEYQYAQIEWTGLAQNQPRVRAINGIELPNWEAATIAAFLTHSGNEGWEMVSPFAGGKQGWTTALILKRPKT